MKYPTLASHYFTATPADVLTEVLAVVPHDKIFVVMPKGCSHELLPLLPGIEPTLLIDDAESAKTLHGLELILKAMLGEGLTRQSLVVNVGGGVTTDIGGLAAALYMRGINYLNIPTTLLAMIDASSGGKTAVDFDGVKNLIGAFHRPLTTIICTRFLSSLPLNQLLSGYGELIKHNLLRGIETAPPDFDSLASSEFAKMVESNVRYKDEVVRLDPTETGLRRILNLGHTAGHAYEAAAIGKGQSVTHGRAVAQGLITALVLSVLRLGFSSEHLQRTALLIRETFSPIVYDCKDYDKLLELMHHDKKNQGKGSIAFTLLSAPGSPVPGIEVSDGEVREALDITRDLLGI